MINITKHLAYHKNSISKYRCPLCLWEVSPEDNWLCGQCGFVWNTFKTRGCCPRCNYQWTMTACLNCGQWSPHTEWYIRETVGE